PALRCAWAIVLAQSIALLLNERARFLVGEARQPGMTAGRAGQPAHLPHVRIITQARGRALRLGDPDELTPVDHGKSHQLAALPRQTIEQRLREIGDAAAG